MSAKVAPDGLNRGTALCSVLGFSEQVSCRWVKKSMQISEKEFFKGLLSEALRWFGGRIYHSHARASTVL